MKVLNNHATQLEPGNESSGLARGNEVAKQNEKVVLVNNPVFEPEPGNESSGLARRKKYLLKLVNSLNNTVFEDQNKDNFRYQIKSGKINT